MNFYVSQDSDTFIKAVRSETIEEANAWTKPPSFNKTNDKFLTLKPVPLKNSNLGCKRGWNLKVCALDPLATGAPWKMNDICIKDLIRWTKDFNC